MLKRGKRPAMTEEDAEALAAKALLFLAEDDRRLVRFLGETGLDPASLREQMGSPALLASVLGYLLGDESQLLVFAAGAGIPPEDVVKAHAMLEGNH